MLLNAGRRGLLTLIKEIATGESVIKESAVIPPRIQGLKYGRIVRKGKKLKSLLRVSGVWKRFTQTVISSPRLGHESAALLIGQSGTSLREAWYIKNKD